MKSLIIIVTFLVSAEISHGIKRVTSNQKILKNSDPEINKPVQGDNSQISLDVSSEPLVIPNEADKKEGVSSTSVAEIKKNATARRDNAIKNAKLALEKKKKDIELREEKITQDGVAAFNKSDEECKEARSQATEIEKKASKNFAEAKQRYTEEYEQAKLAAKKKFMDAEAKYFNTLEAANEEFAKTQGQTGENKRNVESQHQALQIAHEKKDNALKLAKEKRSQAEQKYLDSLKTGWKEENKNEYLEKEDQYEEAVKLVDNEWRKVLNDAGIGSQYEAAEKEALNKLKQTLNEIEKKKDEAKKLAKAEKSKAKNEGDEILREAGKGVEMIWRDIWARRRKLKAEADEELKKAKSEFFEANNAAINEYNEAMQRAEEMEGKMAKVTNTKKMTPAKTNKKRNQRLSRPRRSSSKKGKETA